jgi:hypothetical protein
MEPDDWLVGCFWADARTVYFDKCIVRRRSHHWLPFERAKRYGNSHGTGRAVSQESRKVGVTLSFVHPQDEIRRGAHIRCQRTGVRGRNPASKLDARIGRYRGAKVWPQLVKILVSEYDAQFIFAGLG